MSQEHSTEQRFKGQDLTLRIGATVRSLRREKRLSQRDLAEAVGMTRAAIANIEGGRRGVRVSLAVLEAIAIALGKNRLSALIATAEEIPSRPEAIRRATNALRKIERDAGCVDSRV